MRIVIDKKNCIGCENCVNICPAVFMLWGRYLKSTIDITDIKTDLNTIKEAMVSCPVKAIQLET